MEKLLFRWPFSGKLSILLIFLGYFGSIQMIQSYQSLKVNRLSHHSTHLEKKLNQFNQFCGNNESIQINQLSWCTSLFQRWLQLDSNSSQSHRIGSIPLLNGKRWVRGENIRQWNSRNVLSTEIRTHKHWGHTRKMFMHCYRDTTWTETPYSMFTHYMEAALTRHYWLGGGGV